MQENVLRLTNNLKTVLPPNNVNLSTLPLVLTLNNTGANLMQNVSTNIEAVLVYGGLVNNEAEMLAKDGVEKK